jgi:ribosomal peptide maturation radical SAM protein 1
MTQKDVLLISMPWTLLNAPSIQLGILQSVLENNSISTGTRHFNLSAMEYFKSVTESNFRRKAFTVKDYKEIAEVHWQVGLGDWIFAVPPYLEASGERDENYKTYLQESNISPATIEKVFDFRRYVPGFLEFCLTSIIEVKPKIVGFSSAFSQNVPSLVLAKLLKETFPEIQIVFGGANCDGVMGATLHQNFPWVDVVIRGEAENVFPAYVKNLLNGADRTELNKLSGICFRQNGESVIVSQNAQSVTLMEKVPAPNYDDYFEQFNKSELREELLPRLNLAFESSRGCWWGAKKHCTFCGLNGLTMAFRSKSPDRVFNEVIDLGSRYKQTYFTAVDNIIDMKHIENLLPQFQKLQEEGYDFNFFYEVKANLKKSQLELMSNAGVRSIQPGIESLSTPILKSMRKGTTALQNIRLLKWSAQYGILPVWNIIYGFPEESPEEYEMMAELMKSLIHLPPPNLSRLLIQRFSPYHQTPEEFGLSLKGPAPYYKFIYQVDATALNNLAYDFSHEYVDKVTDFEYVEPVRKVIGEWKKHWKPSSSFLYYKRGLNFITITDNRPNLENSMFLFEKREAEIYLACDGGATAEGIWKKIRDAGDTSLRAGEIEDFLEQLVEARLAFVENGVYLSLAIPLNNKH